MELLQHCLTSRISAPDGRNYHQVMDEFDNHLGTIMRQLFCAHEFIRYTCRHCGVQRTGIEVSKKIATSHDA